MASDNGRRSLIQDLQRALQRDLLLPLREQARREEQLAGALKKEADVTATLDRFRAALGEAFLEKKDPPRAAVDLEHQFADAQGTSEACRAVLAELDRTISGKREQWVRESVPVIRARADELLAAVEAAVAALREAADSYTRFSLEVEALGRPFHHLLPDIRSNAVGSAENLVQGARSHLTIITAPVHDPWARPR